MPYLRLFDYVPFAHGDFPLLFMFTEARHTGHRDVQFGAHGSSVSYLPPCTLTISADVSGMVKFLRVLIYPA